MMVENSDDCANWIKLNNIINLTKRYNFEPLEGIIRYCKPVGEQYGARE